MSDWLSKYFEPESLPPSHACQNCGRDAKVHFTEMSSGKFRSKDDLCGECGRLRFEAYLSSVPVGHASDQDVAVEAELLILSELSSEQLIYFRELGGDRGLSFVTGPFEAMMVDRALRGEPSTRPLTHHSWLASVAALGGRIACGRMHAVEGMTYYGELVLEQDGRRVTLDMRPSDLLVITLLAKSPFFVGGHLFASPEQTG